jgi:hypothetical protein
MRRNQMPKQTLIDMDNWVAIIFELMLEGKLSYEETSNILEDFNDEIIIVE